jgi:hypothetical protein
MMVSGLTVFLAASNMSLVTTTQSKIAEDLDAFAAASWFTSAYMVSMHERSSLPLVDYENRSQCRVRPY